MVCREQVSIGSCSGLTELAQNHRATASRSNVTVGFKRCRSVWQGLFICMDYRVRLERQEHLADHPQVVVGPPSVVVERSEHAISGYQRLSEVCRRRGPVREVLYPFSSVRQADANLPQDFGLVRSTALGNASPFPPPKSALWMKAHEGMP